MKNSEKMLPSVAQWIRTCIFKLALLGSNFQLSGPGLVTVMNGSGDISHAA